MNRAVATILCCVLSFVAGAGLMWTQTRDESDTQPSAADAPAGTVTRREPQFENTEVKSWKSIIMPDQPLSLHRHDVGRAIIALTGGPLDVVDKDGKVLQTYNWEKGKAYWLDADPPGQMHADVNNTGAPIEVIVVQLLKKN